MVVVVVMVILVLVLTAFYGSKVGGGSWLKVKKDTWGRHTHLFSEKKSMNRASLAIIRNMCVLVGGGVIESACDGCEMRTKGYESWMKHG